MIAQQFCVPFSHIELSAYASLTLTLTLLIALFNSKYILILFLLSLLPNIVLFCNGFSRIIYYLPIANNDFVYYMIAIYKYSAVVIWAIINYVLANRLMSNTFSERMFQSILIMSVILLVKKILLLAITYTSVWRSYIIKISESIVTTHIILKFVHFIHKHNPLFDLQQSKSKHQSVYHNFVEMDDDEGINFHDYKATDVVKLIKDESISLKLIHESLEIPDFNEKDCQNIYDQILRTLAQTGITKFDYNAFHYIFESDMKMAKLCECIFEETGDVKYEQFRHVYEQSIREKTGIKGTLNNYGRMIHTLDQFLNAVVVIISMFVFLILLGVNLRQNVSLILSILAATSFIVSSSISRFFEGIIFLFSVRAFDLNDIISVRDESGTEHELTVDKINLLMTTFIRSDGYVVLMSNFRLKDAVIVNKSRSDIVQKIN